LGHFRSYKNDVLTTEARIHPVLHVSYLKKRKMIQIHPSIPTNTIEFET
jgi:hypothetical protein